MARHRTSGWVASGWPTRVLGTAVIVAALATVAVAVLVPRLAGATPYAVLTGSMAPAYPPGTLVVVRPVRPAEVAVGDVITYQLHSGRPEVVTHRVVRSSVSTTTGDYEYVTRGDANEVDDAEPVRPRQVRGELWYAVPHLGRVSVLLDGPERRSAELVVAAVLALYAARSFALAARKRIRERGATT